MAKMTKISCYRSSFSSLQLLPKTTMNNKTITKVCFSLSMLTQLWVKSERLVYVAFFTVVI